METQMFRTLLLGGLAALLTSQAVAARPPAAGPVARSMPDYIINLNRSHSLIGTWQVATSEGLTFATFNPDRTFEGVFLPATGTIREIFEGTYCFEPEGGDRYRLRLFLEGSGLAGQPDYQDSWVFLSNTFVMSDTSGLTFQRVK